MFPPLSWPWAPALFDDPQRDPQETAFLQGILENPDDDAGRLVYADWLDENGQPEKARFVRLEVELSGIPRSDPRFVSLAAELDDLDAAIGGTWNWALVRPGRLLNCGKVGPGDPWLRFTHECRNRWVDLRPTEDPAVRHCEGCRRNVHHCASKAEADRHAVRGDCIAISSRLALDVAAQQRKESSEEAPDMVGRPMSPLEIWTNELFPRPPKRWWRFWR
jgi:uncharacterized protein (TIGR02996 family)